jgi:hypothetical protein
LLRERSPPLPCAARVLAGNQSDVTGQGSPICEPRGIAEEHVRGQRRHWSDPGMRHEQVGSLTLTGLVGDSRVEIVDLIAQVPIQCLQFVAAMACMRGKRPARHRRLAVTTPQGRTAAQALAEGDRLPGILHSCAQPRPLVPMQQQCPQVALLAWRLPNHREALRHQQVEQQFCIPPIMFLLSSVGLPDLRRVPDLVTDPQLVEQLQKPGYCARRFDPDDDGSWQGPIDVPWRVFCGQRIKSETLSKAEATCDELYSIFFNRNGDFKRHSVLQR